MSFMNTLAKVAVGVALAKGASAMMKSRDAKTGAAGGLDGLLSSLAADAGSSGTRQAGAGETLEDMLGGLLGGAAGTGGGLGDLLEGLSGGSGQSKGLQDMLGGIAGGGAGLGGLLGALTGGQPQRSSDNSASFGQVLNSQFSQTPQPAIEPTADQEAAAALMLRAMIQAAKSDHEIDAAEQEKLVGQLGGDVDANEAAFVRAEMNAPADVDNLVSQVPKGMEPQVYAMSVLAINLDSQTEAQYLHKLAQGLGLGTESVNSIHAKLGVPSLYA